MSNQRLMKVKEKAGDGYAKTNAIGRRGGGGAGAPDDPGRGVGAAAGFAAGVAAERARRPKARAGIVTDSRAAQAGRGRAVRTGRSRRKAERTGDGRDRAEEPRDGPDRPAGAGDGRDAACAAAG